MPGRERQQAARARLTRRGGPKNDAQLVEGAVAAARAAAERRGTVEEDAEAERVAADELRRMRADKQARARQASNR